MGRKMTQHNQAKESTKRDLGSVVWMNGKIMSPEQANVSLFTHTLHYGFGAFEGIRAYKTADGRTAVFRLREHIERLIDSCKIMAIRCPYTVDELCAATLDVARQSGLEECYLRPLVYIGDGPLGVFPGFDPPVEVAVLCWKWGAYLGAEAKAKGARIKVSSFCRPHINSQMSKGKIIGHYVNSILAKMEAKRSGYDEGLLLDTEGYVSEGSGENIFVYRGGYLKTTPLPGVLEGITRGTILELCRQESIEVRAERFTRDEIYTADEAFFCGTAAEITPIREIDDRPIGKGLGTGPIVKKISDRYNNVIRGLDKEYHHWLTYL
jgi:branched-chain amino acid aminotransferase